MTERQARISGTSKMCLAESLADHTNGAWPGDHFAPDWERRKIGKHGSQFRLEVAEDQLGDIVWRLERIAGNLRYLIGCPTASSDAADGRWARACERDAERICIENPDLFANGRRWNKWNDDGDDLNDAGFGWGRADR